MQKYELTYIISSDENLQGSENVAKTIEDFVVTEGGKIISKENPSARNLAYSIKKKSSGFLAILNFELDPEKITNIENLVKQEQKIIRYAIFKKRHVHETRSRRAASYAIPKIDRKDNVDENKKEEVKVELKDIEEQLDKILNE